MYTVTTITINTENKIKLKIKEGVLHFKPNCIGIRNVFFEQFLFLQIFLCILCITRAAIITNNKDLLYFITRSSEQYFL